MKKTLHLLLSLLIVIATILAPMRQAIAISAGGWAFGGFSIASETVTAIKAGVSATARVASSATVGQIGKSVLVGAIGSAAIVGALPALIGLSLDAVDWVLDPANNQIKWSEKEGQFTCWDIGNVHTANSIAAISANLQCSSTSVAFVGERQTDYKCFDSQGYYSTTFSCGKAAAKSGTVSIPTLAQKIYDNAKAGDGASIDAVNTAVRTIVDSGTVDSSLDNAAKCGTGTHMSGGLCVADTPAADNDKAFDPSGIIAAIKSLFDMLQGLLNGILTAVMSIPDLIKSVWDWAKDSFQYIKDTATKWSDSVVKEYQAVKDAVTKEYTDVRDWVYSKDTVKDIDEKSKKPPPDIPVVTTPDFDLDSLSYKPYVQFSKACPPAPTFNVYGTTLAFPIQLFCDFCEQFSYVVLAFAWLRALVIVGSTLK